MQREKTGRLLEIAPSVRTFDSIPSGRTFVGLAWLPMKQGLLNVVGETLKTPILKAVIDDLLEGQYNDPVRILVLNLTASWVRGASDEIARKLRQRCVNEGGEVPDSLQQFVEEAAGT